MLDHIDKKLIQLLAADARASLKALAQASGLSAPSVTERLRRLEERGVLTGYTIAIDTHALGYQIQAIVRIRPLPGQLHSVERQILATPEFTECDKVTGADCYIARLLVRTLPELELELDLVLDRFASSAQTNTAIIKSTPLKRRLPPLAGGD